LLEDCIKQQEEEKAALQQKTATPPAPLGNGKGKDGKTANQDMMV
jgi:hypothetical protein